MATMSELAADLATVTAQVDKARAEIISKIADLEAALADVVTTPEVDAALAALKVAVQATDDVVPDDPVV